jgi:hypothetical protein
MGGATISLQIDTQVSEALSSPDFHRELVCTNFNFVQTGDTTVRNIRPLAPIPCGVQMKPFKRFAKTISLLVQARKENNAEKTQNHPKWELSRRKIEFERTEKEKENNYFFFLKCHVNETLKTQTLKKKVNFGLVEISQPTIDYVLGTTNNPSEKYQAVNSTPSDKGLNTLTRAPVTLNNKALFHPRISIYAQRNLEENAQNSLTLRRIGLTQDNKKARALGQNKTEFK